MSRSPVQINVQIFTSRYPVGFLDTIKLTSHIGDNYNCQYFGWLDCAKGHLLISLSVEMEQDLTGMKRNWTTIFQTGDKTAWTTTSIDNVVRSITYLSARLNLPSHSDQLSHFAPENSVHFGFAALTVEPMWQVMLIAGYLKFVCPTFHLSLKKLYFIAIHRMAQLTENSPT